MDKSKLIVRMYSFFLALLPILNLYRSVVPVLTLGESGLIFFLVMLFITIVAKGIRIEFGKRKINTWPIVLFIIFIFLTCIAILFIGNGPVSIIDILRRLLRIALWAFSISFLGYFLFDFDHTQRWIIRISMVATLYIIIQYIFWHLFTIYLPSLLSIGFIHPSSVGYTDVDRLTQYYNNFYYRPASFFGEPAFYSYYSLVGLIVSLFKTKTGIKINRIIPIFLSIGIILSTSTAGIYLMFLVWCYYVYKRLYSKKLVIRLLKTVLFALPIVLLLVLLFPWISTSLEGSNYFSKIGVILSKPFDFVNSSRLGKSYSLFSLLDGFQRIVGVGFGNEDIYLQLDSVYYNSVTVLLLCTGYIGLIIFLISSIKLLQKKNPISFILAVIYILLCFTSSMLYSSFSIVYLTIIFYIDSNSFIYKMTNSYNKE